MKLTHGHFKTKIRLRVKDDDSGRDSPSLNRQFNFSLLFFFFKKKLAKVINDPP